MRRLVVFIAAMLLAAPVNAEPLPIEGNWKTGDGKAIIRIAPCGAAMCGRIVELLTPGPPGGARDTRNPDESQRGRSLLGLRVFWNLTPDGNRFAGKGYSPERGRHFDAQVWRDGDRLRVKGCVSVICQTQILTRV